ncbi:hypothetical protein TNCV_2120601 [Trichonephila clavipes]|nr:hypothetical protein TNCV_2120601 [Trichonephila clavipes]
MLACMGRDYVEWTNGSFILRETYLTEIHTAMKLPPARASSRMCHWSRPVTLMIHKGTGILSDSSVPDLG